MLKDDLFIRLCEALVRDPKLVSAAPWSVLVMVGEIEPGGHSLHGFRFDAQGQWTAVAPGGDAALNLLPRLRDAMATSDPARAPWVACLIRIDAQGHVNAEFEYDDPARWHVTAANHAQLVQEFTRIAQEGLTPEPVQLMQ